MTKQGQTMVDDLMGAIKVITADYVAKLPAAKFIMKVEKTVTEEVAVDLPIFRINSCFAYKVISQDRCIQVQYGIEGSEQIGFTHSNLAWCTNDTIDCPEAEFSHLYKKIILILTNI